MGVMPRGYSDIDIKAGFSETNVMKRIFGNTIVIAPIVFLPTAAFAADQPQDEFAIRALEARQQEAWNHHDAKAYASLFAEDGDCVNVVGWWWKWLRLANERQHSHDHGSGYSVSHSGVCGSACPLDDDRRENSEWTSRPTTRHPDALAAKSRWPMADCGLPEY